MVKRFRYMGLPVFLFMNIGFSSACSIEGKGCKKTTDCCNPNTERMCNVEEGQCVKCLGETELCGSESPPCCYLCTPEQPGCFQMECRADPDYDPDRVRCLPPVPSFQSDEL